MIPAGRAWRSVTSDAATEESYRPGAGRVRTGPETLGPAQFARLHGALSDGTTLPVTVADARASIELITAAYHSAATGETVRLPIGTDHPAYAAGAVDSAASCGPVRLPARRERPTAAR
jgi:hypothetical protein